MKGINEAGVIIHKTTKLYCKTEEKKVKKVFLAVLAVLLVTALIFGGCAKPEAPAPTAPAPTTPAPAPPAPAEAIELKFSHPFSPMAPHAAACEEWGKKVEQVTDGRVKITFYPAGSLVADPDAYPALISGVSDIAILTDWRVPQLEFESIFNLPFLGWTNDNCLEIRNQMDKEFPQLAAVRSECKTLFLIGIPIGSGILTRDKEVHVPDDIKGMQFIGTATLFPFFEACGATGVALPPPEHYGALEKGIVDGCLAGYMQIAENKLDEVIKFCLENPMGGSAMDVLMNKDKWNSLPPDIQQIIEGTLPEAEQATFDAQLESEMKEHDRIIAEKKIKVSVSTPDEAALWAEKALPSHQKWVEDMTAKGYPAQDALDKLHEIISRYK